ncbi:MAG: hypothetical protein IT289_06600 [Oligoflexia bacterium]|nr:hypothetical protein [Oligoflexia bacterium]
MGRSEEQFLTSQKATALIISKKHGQQLSPYKGNQIPIKIRCHKKHNFLRLPSQLKAGAWCFYCSGTRIYDVLDKVAQIGKKNNFILVSKIYSGKRKRLQLQCIKCNYKFTNSIYNALKGRKCPHCAGRRRTIADVKLFAKSRGFVCVSKSYIKAVTKLSFICPNGHGFTMSYNKFSSPGTKCPRCMSFVGEEVCRTLLEEMLGKRFPKQRPKWLSGLELDGYCNELGLAFEHHGEQHFKHGNLFTKNKVHLKKRQSADALRRRICSQHGINLIEVSSVGKDLPIDKVEGFLIKKLVSFGLKPLVKYKSLNLNAIYSPNKLESYFWDVAGKGILVLDHVYLGEKYPLRHECMVCNYVWSVPPQSLRKSAFGCPRCAGNLPLNINEVKSRAEKWNCIVLSRKIINSKRKLKIKCLDCGSVYQASAEKMTIAKNCKTCQAKATGDRSRLTMSEIKIRSMRQKLKPMFKFAKNNSTPLPFRCLICDKSHMKSIMSVSAGHGCPSCWRVRQSKEKKINESEIRRRIKPYNYKLLKADGVTSLTVQCLGCKKTRTTSVYNIMRAQRCQRCITASRKINS